MHQTPSRKTLKGFYESSKENVIEQKYSLLEHKISSTSTIVDLVINNFKKQDKGYFKAFLNE